MTRFFLALMPLMLAGCVCNTPEYDRPDPTGEPWDTSYLLDLDPDDVTRTDLGNHAVNLNTRYWAYHQDQGVVWPGRRSDPALDNPDIHSRGGDSGLFTGQALAAYSFRYMAEPLDGQLQDVLTSVRGMYILTHATGTPGVICRQAFPSDRPAEFSYPDAWKSRIEEGFVDTGPAIVAPFGDPGPQSYTYYTRATKDQMTGVVLGLAAAWRALNPLTVPPAHKARAIEGRRVVSEVVEAVHAHLVAHGWNIRDERGLNDTSADHVDGLLRTGVLALMTYAVDSRAVDEYSYEFDRSMQSAYLSSFIDRFNNYQQYFAYNLRSSRSLAIWLLEGSGSAKSKRLMDYYRDNVWSYVRGHRVAYFAFIQASFDPSDSAAAEEGQYSLKSLSLKPVRMWSSPYYGQEHHPGLLDVLLNCTAPYVVDPHLRKPTEYSAWEKRPWDVGKSLTKVAVEDTTGIDYLIAYWLARWRNHL